jgi:hypothetical protein
MIDAKKDKNVWRLEGRVAAAPETGGSEEENQPDCKGYGNQQGDEPPDEAERYHAVIVPLSTSSWAAGFSRWSVAW